MQTEVLFNPNNCYPNMVPNMPVPIVIILIDSVQVLIAVSRNGAQASLVNVQSMDI